MIGREQRTESPHEDRIKHPLIILNDGEMLLTINNEDTNLLVTNGATAG